MKKLLLISVLPLFLLGLSQTAFAQQRVVKLTLENTTNSDLTVKTFPANTTVNPTITTLPKKGKAITQITQHGVGADYTQFSVREPWITITIKGTRLIVTNCSIKLCPRSVSGNEMAVTIGKATQ